MNGARRLLLAGLGVLGAAWMVAPLHAPALYDGVGFPDEPYRYVVPPPGYRQTPPPTTATGTYSLSRGVVQNVFICSAEQGPQVCLSMPDDRLGGVPASARVTVAAVPSAPTPEPADGTVFGNVYRIGARAAAVPVTSVRAEGNTGFVQLRAPHAPPPTPVMEIHQDGRWRRLATSRVGNDIFSAPFAGVGGYAMVIPRGVSTGGGGIGPPILALIVVVIVLAAAVVAVRVSRTRRGRPAQPLR